MDIQRALNTPYLRVKLIALIHFTLVAFALQSYWLPSAYSFYNLIYILSLFWAIQCRESVDAIHIASLINASSFIFDLIGIIAHFPNNGGIFSVVFAIFNLALRPFTLLVLHRELIDRGGSFAISGGSNDIPANYEDIDRTHQTFSPNV
ncbi:type-1 angiotensin II receptor-associated protein-like [Toxorhynchites rutilus septentrionalis]|uniref:type-1 angiotensin II receptor-associated protein-like n=1 Tax=Toxorhynchites rutilus septentrionalis TaxID=329112 RepID=UPI0024797D3C|nr:type-1 angiotensin II receptor-associated protein-like [Toxorhynchites rutilus septentrionalis]XP_055627322.1 type-1 angiotensin II receptor-associated protein-like [Toxorhynchites rutilus septentrionalis]